MKRAQTLSLTTTPTPVGLRPASGDTYNSAAYTLGPLMAMGMENSRRYVGPLPVSVMRPMEASTAIAFAYPVAMNWYSDAITQLDWVFVAENSTAAATRRFGMYRYDKATALATYDGFINVTFPGTSEAKTIRGMRIDYRKEDVGTVAVTGTAVTGTGTRFVTSRVCVGNRIGFGTSEPSGVTQWYQISAIASNGSLTLTTPVAATVVAGASYVIEDLRLLVAVTSLTTSNGGLYLIKGLCREAFSSSGTAIPAATTVDNIRACYYLKDATTGTAIVTFGLAQEEFTGDYASRNIWILETLANPVLFKFNARAALVLTAGAATSAFLYKTGAGGALTGSASQVNNGRIAVTNHGPGAGLECIYFTTATRIYRTADVSTITTGSTSWLIDNMTEVPPGSVNTFALTGSLQSIEYSGLIDKFVITSGGAAGARSYLSEYRTDGGQMDRIIFADYKQSDQSIADSTTTPFPGQNASGFTVWVEGGMAYIARMGTTSVLNQIYFVPLGADWEYASLTGSSVIFPAIYTTGARRYDQVFTQSANLIGGAAGKNLGMTTEPYRVYYRTAFIDVDENQGWQLVPSNGDLAGVGGAGAIQFKLEFRVGNTMIPARIYGIGVVYDDSSMSEFWQASSNVGTSLANKRFGFRQLAAYGAGHPPLVAEIWDAETNMLLGTDSTISPAWTWETSTNSGATWVPYSFADRTNGNCYLRFTPTSLADNIKVRAVLREQ